MTTQEKLEAVKAKDPILNNRDFYYDVSEDDGAGYDGYLKIISVVDGSCLKIEISKLLADIYEQQKLRGK